MNEKGNIHWRIQIYGGRKPAGIQVSWIREDKKRLGDFVAQIYMVLGYADVRRSDDVLYVYVLFLGNVNDIIFLF